MQHARLMLLRSRFSGHWCTVARPSTDDRDTIEKISPAVTAMVTLTNKQQTHAQGASSEAEDRAHDPPDDARMPAEGLGVIVFI
jgi:hypothetical protein